MLARTAARRIVMLQPPHARQTVALAGMGLPPSAMLRLRAKRTADAWYTRRSVRELALELQ